MLHYTITEHQAGQRVDKALHLLFPELSIRARKDLWQSHHITLNGRKTAAGHVVKIGDVLSATIREIPCENAVLLSDNNDEQKQALEAQVHVVGEVGPWLFFHKPCGLHSVRIAGGGASLQDYVEQHTSTYGKVYLCNRLDAKTSGIIVTARSPEGQRQWQHLEDAGQCQKRYVALVHLRGEASVRRVRVALDTHKRKISRVLHEEAETLRHSYFTPLGAISTQEYAALREFFPSFPESSEEAAAGQLFLTGCTIYKGVRHQIRAHAAYAGFPLFNDTRYKERLVPEHEDFALHHGALSFGRDGVQALAPWQRVLGPKLHQAIQEFFSIS